MELQTASLATAAAEAVKASGGDAAWAFELLSRWLESAPELQRRLIDWGCEQRWWDAGSWGRENGLWELAVRHFVAEACRATGAGTGAAH